MSTAINTVMEQLHAGVEGLYSPEELRRKLESGRKLRIKYGMDPTAPDIHLGHTVQLRRIRQFQDLGHQAVLIIGDYTARIGDPSGRDTTRPILDEAAIARNARTYLEQAGKILDTAPDKLEQRHNSEWLSKLTFAEVLKLTGLVTVQQMLHRENFKLRLQNEREIMLSEFMYPIMQAYDSVVVKADVEFGGSDQTFNCLLAREVMGKLGLERQVVMITPILVGLDGQEKMSKSKGNYVALTDAPTDMFGKIMSIPDALMANYFRLLTTLPAERINSLVDQKMTHPRAAKDILARIIVEEFYHRDAANHASDSFRRQFSEHQLPSDLPTRQVSKSPLGILDLIVEAGFAPSKSEARRLIVQGGVSLDGQKIVDSKASIEVNREMVLKVGKLRVCKIRGGK